MFVSLRPSWIISILCGKPSKFPSTRSAAETMNANCRYSHTRTHTLTKDHSPPHTHSHSSLFLTATGLWEEPTQEQAEHRNLRTSFPETFHWQLNGVKTNSFCTFCWNWTRFGETSKSLDALLFIHKGHDPDHKQSNNLSFEVLTVICKVYKMRQIDAN